MALDSILSMPVIPPPPKSSTSSSSSSSSSSGSNASFGAGNPSDSTSATHQTSGSDSNGRGANNSDPSHSARDTSKNASSRGSGSSTGQAQSSARNSQNQKSSGANQAQSTSSASNGKNGAAQSARNPGPSFLQTLAAQSQADAQDSATAATASPMTVTGKGKGKTAKDGNSAANSAASFGFLSQSLVAAMAGIQQQPPAKDAAGSDDSVDGVSLSSGTSAQSLVANLMQSTAEEPKAAAADGAKADAAPGNTTAAPPDVSTAAASTFQSHLGVSSQSQTQASPHAASTQVNTPVGASGFADEVGDKITWMAHQGVQSASLQMTPEHMGPVEVKISVQAGSATVSINAAHADTRAALEQALPRLREMFSTQGMNLTDASVSQQFSREQPQKRAVGAIGAVSGVSDEGAAAVVSVAGARLGLVDTYA